MMGLHHSGTVLLFPKKLSTTRFDWASSLSYDSLVSRIKLVTQRLGLPVDDYSGHSLRVRGATDLFIARVPYFIIKKMGRWASDAAMVHCRHDGDVIREVSTAFQLVANPISVCRGGHTTSSLGVTSLQYRVGGVVAVVPR